MANQPGRKILRVGLFQNQRLLEERLMRNAETVTIGHDLRKNTLVVPASNLPRSFAVFEYDKNSGKYLLQFTEKMGGKISRGKGVETLEELRRSGAAKKKGSVYQLVLEPTTRGRVEVGEAAVVFQFVTPPPVRPAPVLPASMRGGLINTMERPLAVLILVSAILQVGFVIFLEMQDWPPRDDQEFRIPDRMARIVVPPPEEDPPEPDSTDGDETRPAEEESASEPEPDASAEEPTPEEVAEQRQEERLEVTERVRDSTIISTLTADGDGPSRLDRLRDNIGNVSTDEAFEGTTRVETGNTRADRLGRGGGSPDAGSGELAQGEELGQIGGADRNVDRGERQEAAVERVNVDVAAPDDVMGGTLDTAALQRALRQLSNNVQACYRDYLRTNPNASGSVRVLITITARGSRGVIQSAEVAADTVSGNNRVGQCVARELQAGRVRLPPPEDGDVQVTVPFHFAPGG